jgi:hypothetical protein
MMAAAKVASASSKEVAGSGPVVLVAPINSGAP